MQEFLTFVEKLSARLQLPLPAQEAHNLMASSSRIKAKIAPNERTRESAVLIVFYPYKDEILLPLILRPAYDGVHGGQMAFPGGRAEREDENLIRTAMREAQEEIGIRLSDVTVLGMLTKLYIPPSNFFVQPVVAFMKNRPDFYPDEREVDKVIEISLREISDKNIIGQKIIHVRGHEVDAPFYNIQENTVWGATAMMIAELLAVIESM